MTKSTLAIPQNRAPAIPNASHLPAPRSGPTV